MLHHGAKIALRRVVGCRDLVAHHQNHAHDNGGRLHQRHDGDHVPPESQLLGLQKRHRRHERNGADRAIRCRNGSRVADTQPALQNEEGVERNKRGDEQAKAQRIQDFTAERAVC